MPAMSLEPTFSLAHGFYTATQLVGLTSLTPGATIVYTTDGSTPTVDSNLAVTQGNLYTGSITVSGTTTLRARSFKTDFKPSFVASSSYLFCE